MSELSSVPPAAPVAAPDHSNVLLLSFGGANRRRAEEAFANGRVDARAASLDRPGRVHRRPQRSAVLMVRGVVQMRRVRLP